MTACRGKLVTLLLFDRQLEPLQRVFQRVFQCPTCWAVIALRLFHQAQMLKSQNQRDDPMARLAVVYCSYRPAYTLKSFIEQA